MKKILGFGIILGEIFCSMFEVFSPFYIKFILIGFNVLMIALKQAFFYSSIWGLIIDIQVFMILTFGFLVSGFTREYNIKLAYITEQRVRKDSDNIVLEKKKNENLIFSILPKDVVDKMKKNGFSSYSGTCWKNSFVVFLKLKNFSFEIHEADPEREKGRFNNLLSFLSGIFGKFDERVGFSNFITIKKIQATYLFVTRPGNSNQAVRVLFSLIRTLNLCCLDFKDESKKFEVREKQLCYGQNQNDEIKKPFELKIGISFGSFGTGVLGKKKFLFDIFGDTVNYAARLCSISENCKLNVSNDNISQIKLLKNFILQYRGKFKLKGKGVVECSNIALKENTNLSTILAIE